MLFLDTILIRFTGPGFRSARAVIPVLMLAKLFLGIYYNLSIWYKLSGNTLWGALITIAGAVITIGLNILLIPLPDHYLIHGYLGSAYATLACYTGMMILGYLTGQKYYPIPYNLKKFFGYTGLVLVLYGVSEWIKPSAFLLNIAFNSALLAIFLVIIWFSERKSFGNPA
jgi:O-antigen/teichoic acid export membrane protein